MPRAAPSADAAEIADQLDRLPSREVVAAARSLGGRRIQRTLWHCSAANDPIIDINGVAQTLTEFKSPTGTYQSDAAFNARIGQAAWGTARTFDGTIDDVRLYVRELTAGDIAAMIPPEITARETVDSNDDGQIDRIRITTSKNLNDDFDDLDIDVSGYTVTGYSTGDAGDNVFFVDLTPSGTPDTGVTPLVNVVTNRTLMARMRAR